MKKSKSGRSTGRTTGGRKRPTTSVSAQSGAPKATAVRSGNPAKSRYRSSVNALELLKADHERVNSLFEDYETSGGEDKHVIADKIMKELEVHATIEEEIFYPALRGIPDKDSITKVSEAIKEHKRIRGLIRELRGLDPDDDILDAKFREMMREVMHHVDEEENDMFPLAEKHLADELAQLGKELDDRKQRLLKA